MNISWLLKVLFLIFPSLSFNLADKKFTIKQYEIVNAYLPDLKPDPDNPNVMSPDQKQALAKGMQRYGFLVPIIFDQNNMIIDGHNRVKELLAKNVDTAPAYRVTLKDAVERRMLRQMLNQLHGKNDPEKYALELKAIFEGGRLDDLAELLAQPREVFEYVMEKQDLFQFAHDDNADIDKELQGPEVARTGDLWELGDHRLVCGDNQDSAALALLLEGVEIAQLNTDPPYGVNYSSKNEFFRDIDYGRRPIKAYFNDDPNTDYKAMFNKIFSAIPWAPHNTVYIWTGGYAYLQIRAAMEESGLTWSADLIWVKNNHVFGRKDYNPKHELCIYGWKGRHKFYGPFRTSVLEYDKPLVNDLHPTMKPIEMIAQVIADGTKKGDVVLDVFGGSGSTLIACEQTGRKCRIIEIMPRFADVIIRRWEKMTGKKARLLSRAEGKDADKPHKAMEPNAMKGEEVEISADNSADAGEPNTPEEERK